MLETWSSQDNSTLCCRRSWRWEECRRSLEDKHPATWNLLGNSSIQNMLAAWTDCCNRSQQHRAEER